MCIRDRDKEDVGITIESKSIDNTELGITDVATQNTMLVVFVIIIPIAILVACVNKALELVCNKALFEMCIRDRRSAVRQTELSVAAIACKAE